MADESSGIETTLLIFMVTFLALSVVLFTWIPVQFGYALGDVRQISPPEELFETIDIYSFFETRTIWMNESGGRDWWLDNTFYIEDIDIGNWDIDFYYKKANETTLSCRIIHIHYEWIILPADHFLEWYDTTGVNVADSDGYLSVDAIETNGVGGNSRFRTTCAGSWNHFSLHAEFAYNTTLYSSFENAWDHHGLYAFFGIDFDDVNTSYNAWDLIARLLFFQLPDVQTHINVLLAIPFWIAICTTIFLFIIKIIPLI